MNNTLSCEKCLKLEEKVSHLLTKIVEIYYYKTDNYMFEHDKKDFNKMQESDKIKILKDMGCPPSCSCMAKNCLECWNKWLLPEKETDHESRV